MNEATTAVAREDAEAAYARAEAATRRSRPPSDTLERVSWWADVFNVPCVGYAGTSDEAVQIAQAGADFVALGDAVWSDPRGPKAAMEEIARLVLLAERAQPS